MCRYCEYNVVNVPVLWCTYSPSGMITKKENYLVVHTKHVFSSKIYATCKCLAILFSILTTGLNIFSLQCHFILSLLQSNAFSLLEKCIQQETTVLQANPSYYVDAQTLQSVYKASGINFAGVANGGIQEGGSEDEGNASEEEVVEEEEEEERPQQHHFALNGSAKFF